MDAPEALDGGIDEGADGRGIADVGLSGHDAGSAGFEFGGDIVHSGVDVAQGEGDALSREDAGNAVADAVSSPGDDGGCAFEVAHEALTGSMGR